MCRSNLNYLAMRYLPFSACRYLLLLGAVALLLSGCQQPTWERRELSQGVTVESPYAFGREQSGPNTDTFISADDHYGVVVSRVTGNPMAAEQMLAYLKASTLKQLGAKESHSEDTSFQNQPAIRFGAEVVDGEKKVAMESLIVKSNDEMFVQLVSYDGDHEKFFASLVLPQETGGSTPPVAGATPSVVGSPTPVAK